MKPWERYAEPAKKPWERYASPSVVAPSQSEPNDPAMADGPLATGEQPETPRRMSTAEQGLRNLARPIGKAARMAVQGAVGLPAMFANAAAGASNFAFGTHIPDQHQNVSRLLTNLGLPEYEGAVERVLGGIGESLTGTGVAVKGGEALARGGGEVARRVGDMLRTAPATQAQAAAGAGAGSGIAREMDAHPAVQVLAGVAGGVAAPLAAQLPGAAWRGTKALLEPFSQRGQEKIAGGRINVAASNRNEAIANMRTAEEIIPGSFPTTGEASRDLGLIGLQKTVTERSKGMGEGMPFGDRAQAQNTARLNAIHRVAGDREQLAGMVQGRNARTAPMREGALSRTDPGPRAIQPPDPDPVFEWSMFPPQVRQSADVEINTGPALARIEEILASPIGARRVVQQALGQARTAIEGETNARRLYEVGKDINKTILTQLQKEGADVSVARGAMGEVRRSLYDSIDEAAPGFNNYLRRYEQDSVPINQTQTMQRITDDVYLAPTDTSGQPIVSQAKWSRQVKRALPRLQEEGDLSEDQIVQLVRIGDDLDRGALLNNPFAKSAGSDTVRNMTGANLVGAIAGGNVNLGPVASTLMRPLNFLYKIPNQQMERLLQEAMLDPGLAARLMANVTPKATAEIGAALRRKATAMGIAIPYGSDRDKRNGSN